MSDRYYGYNIQPALETDDPMPRMRPVIRILGVAGKTTGTVPVRTNDFPDVLQVATEAVKATPFRRGSVAPHPEDVAKSVVEALQAFGALIPFDINGYIQGIEAAEAVAMQDPEAVRSYFRGDDAEDDIELFEYQGGGVRAVYRGEDDTPDERDKTPSKIKLSKFDPMGEVQ